MGLMPPGPAVNIPMLQAKVPSFSLALKPSVGTWQANDNQTHPQSFVNLKNLNLAARPQDDAATVVYDSPRMEFNYV